MIKARRNAIELIFVAGLFEWIIPRKSSPQKIPVVFYWHMKVPSASDLYDLFIRESGLTATASIPREVIFLSTKSKAIFLKTRVQCIEKEKD